jgi:hypothetical protein
VKKRKKEKKKVALYMIKKLKEPELTRLEISETQ